MPDTIATTNEIIGGPNRARVAALATTNVTLLNGAQAMLYGFALYAKAAAATARFVKFYDKATAPVVGTDTPAFTVPLVSTTTYAAEAVANFDEGVPFKLGLAYAITGGVADGDTTACVADDVHGVILWK